MRITKTATGWIIDSDGDLTLHRDDSPCFAFVDAEGHGTNTSVIALNGFTFWTCVGGFRRRLKVTWVAIKFIWGW